MGGSSTTAELRDSMRTEVAVALHEEGMMIVPNAEDFLAVGPQERLRQDGTTEVI